MAKTFREHFDNFLTSAINRIFRKKTLTSILYTLVIAFISQVVAFGNAEAIIEFCDGIKAKYEPDSFQYIGATLIDVIWGKGSLVALIILGVAILIFLIANLLVKWMETHNKESPRVEETIKEKVKEGIAKAGLQVTGYPKCLNKLPGLPEEFVGRKEELSEVANLLQENKPLLLLNGIGGIGKTTLAKKYLHESYDLHDHIAWISVLSENESTETGFRTTAEALGGDLDLMENLGVAFDSEEEVLIRAKKVLKKLRQVPGKNLLVIDNAGFSLEEIRKDLPTPPEWQVLVTSRKELSGLAVKRIDELPPAKALELFYLYYPGGEKEEGTVRKLLEHIGYHTLSIELFAKICKKSPSTTPQKIYRLLQEKRLSALNRKVWSAHSEREVEVYIYLLGAFELAKHERSEAEVSLLLQLAILPSEELSWELLLKLFPKSNRIQNRHGKFVRIIQRLIGIIQTKVADQWDLENTLLGLVEKGWIAQSEGYRVHQMIQEIIRYKFPPTEENCRTVINGVADLLYIDQSKDNPIDKFPFVIYGEAILSYLIGNASETLGKNLGKLSSNLALVYKDLGRYEDAAKLLEAALQSAQTNFGEQHPTVAISRSNLALVYQDLGRYEDAAKLLEAALQSAQTNFGEQHPNVARSRSNLAVVYQDLGRYEDAAKLLEAALQSDQTNFGEQHPNVARSRSNLAVVYQDLGRYEDAAKLLEAALQSAQTNFGEQHPNVAISRSNLAVVYKDLGRYEDAAKLLEAALQSDQTNFGEQHPSVAISRSNLALVYQDLGRYEDAAKLLEAALQSDQTNFGEQHPNVAIRSSNLALVYQDLGRYEDAAKLLEAALQSYQTNFGEQHPTVAISRSNLALVYQDLGRYEDAAKLLEAALQSDQTNFGEQHPTVAIRSSNLAVPSIRIWGDMKKRLSS